MAPSSTFYSSVCRVLGALNRGALHKQPHVTVPASRAAWELGRALTAVGVLGGVSAVARRGGGGGGGTSSGSGGGLGHNASSSLRYALRYDRGAPLYTPPGPAGHLSAPLSLGAPVLESCVPLSRPTCVRRATLGRLRALRRQLPPGLLLLSTDAGALLTDAEAEFLGVGGVVLGHVRVPLAQAVQARALLREKHEHECVRARGAAAAEAGGGAAAAAAAARGGGGGGGQRRQQHALLQRLSRSQRVPLGEWSSRDHVARTVLPRLLPSAGGGGGGGAAGQALALLDAAEAREKRAAAAVAAARALAAQLATEEAALRGGQVPGGEPASALLPSPPVASGGGGGGGGENGGDDGDGRAGRRRS